MCRVDEEMREKLYHYACSYALVTLSGPECSNQHLLYPYTPG